MTFAEKQPVPSTEQVRRVLSEAAVLRSVTNEERDRIATDLPDAIVGALAHGATVHDLSNDLYSFLTVAYDLTVSVDECADLARRLIRLNTSSVERW